MRKLRVFLLAVALCAATVSVQVGRADAAVDEIHWTFTGQTSVTFDWRGAENTIRFGPTTAYGQTVTASTPSPLPFSSSGPFWEAKLTGLQANTLYHYSVGGAADHTFRTPIPRGSSGFDVYVEGDIGDASYPTMPVVQSLIAGDMPAFVLMAGDLTYGNSHGQASVDRHYNDVMVWSQDAAYMPAWGNHEWDTPSADDLRNYKGRFELPNQRTSPGSPAVSCCGEDWYWFDYGNVRFIAFPEPWSGAWSDWRTKATAVMDSAQSDPAIKFIVTFGHRPALSSGHHPGDATLKSYMDGLGATHSKYVLNLNGHSHNYERSYPQSGVVHITAGTGGSSLEEDGSCLWLQCAQPSWSAFRAMHLGQLKLHFTSTGIEGTFLCGPSGAGTNDVSCAKGTVVDAFVIGTSSGAAPIVNAPAGISGQEGRMLTVSATAADPDGDPIASLTADLAALPAGNNAVFTTGSGNTSGTLTWTPASGTARPSPYDVAIIARNTQADSATTAITVTSADRAPVVTAPATASVTENSSLTVTIAVADPDGNAITALTASGTAVTAGATFAKNAANTSATLSWTPTFTQAGSYGATFTATNSLTGSATTAITVTNTDRAPVVTPPATAAGPYGTLITFTITAADPDGNAMTALSGAPLPSGATFTANAAFNSGTFSWTPAAAQTGTFNVTFTATNALSGSATTAITVTSGDRAPVVTAPATATVAEGSPLTVSVTASDPDGTAITTLAASGTAVTAGAAFAKNAANTSGTLSWTPSFTQAGSYGATFTAANALSGSAATTITVTNIDRAPVVTAPAIASGPYSTLITFTVTAADPDGSALTALSGAPLPSGATFTANAALTSGTFSWTPTAAQTGTFNVTFAAANALSGSATTAVTVTSGDRAPVVTAPATASGPENSLLTINVAAADPDGDAITTLAASGTAVTAGAAFAKNAANTSGTLSWTPTYFQKGTYSATFTATNGLSGAATTAITITNVNRPPVVTAPATVSGAPNVHISFNVTAMDPDGNTLVGLSAAPLPSGATFTTASPYKSGTFNWTPSTAQTGTYNVTFTSTDDQTGSATTAITVTGGDRAPVVTAPATVSGPTGSLITFTLSAADPDGDAISTLTAAGTAVTAGGTIASNATNTAGTFSWTPSASQAGSFAATFTAANALSGSATTAITVTSAPGPNLVGNPSFESSTSGWNGNGGGTVQRVAGGYDGAYSLEIQGAATGTGQFGANDSPNWVVSTPAAGTVYRFTAWVSSAAARGSGQLRVREYVGSAQQGTTKYSPAVPLSSTWQKVTFDYAALASGSTLDFQVIDAPVVAGEAFFTDNISIQIVTGGAAAAALARVQPAARAISLAAVVVPNPFNPEAVIAFTTSPQGACHLRIYDSAGRLVRSLLEEMNLPAGRHEVRFNGRDAAGRKVASGVYFYNLEAPNGSTRGRMVLMK